MYNLPLECGHSLCSITLSLFLQLSPPLSLSLSLHTHTHTHTYCKHSGYVQFHLVQLTTFRDESVFGAFRKEAQRRRWPAPPAAIQSTLRRPEVHRLYVHFNVSSPFVLHVWGIMICIMCGQSQKFSLKTKGYNF